ncbi:heavy-metal-associated domain-containing protein [Phormidium tenue]|uniref:HMA domain-containing protein n=1 Tax=Phormidium tenue NIES-30 TaxID=549789 RepID=A0A1U7J7Q9_9CYAN|nr:cation transporter [Phormidium tenue]MBD2231477.1 cation transporter [Phormidium tenue FACHB-1052]OKH49133.1 hypothetical protein NIES30_08195 [Phormidium tenue NIES-30]
MKKYIAHIVLSASLLSFSSVALAEEVTVTVKGMVCSFCAQGIKKTFGKLESVENVEVDLDKKFVKLDLKDGATLSDETIKEAINDAGYEVEKMERK